MNRRTFLTVSFGAGTVYGLSELFGQDKQDDRKGGRPAHFEKALAEMKRTGKAGLVFVVPEDEKLRRRVGQLLHEIVEQSAPFYCNRKLREQKREWRTFRAHWERNARDLSAAAVLICLSERTAKKLFSPGENRILLDPRGREIARARVDDKKLEPGPLHELVSFVKGAELVHLRRIARTTAAGLAESERARVEEALAVLQRAEPPLAERSEAMAAVRRVAGRIKPLLLLAREEARSTTGRARLQRLLDSVLRKRETGLPFGAKMPNFGSCGCGSWEELAPGAKPAAVAVACGMALPTPEGRKFVRFLE